MKISIIIPAFNEGERIEGVLKEVLNKNYNVVAVDDGSIDKTYEVLSKLKVKSKKLIVLKHKVNLGKGAAMKTGAEYAFSHGAEAVIFMDSDGQHKISDLSKFVVALDKDKYDLAIGIRKPNKNKAWRY